MSQTAQVEWKGHLTGAPSFDLETLVAPLDATAFLQRDYGKRFLHVPGTPGKFTPLLPWATLNEILEQHRLEPPRLRLTREGKPVPEERYASFQPNRRRSGSPIPRINAAGLTRELREGATLVLDNVDELHRPVRRLAESLERIFRVRIQVNAYSGWRTSHGFDLHWDDHDVFILQVAGRKHWKVYGMTRPFPLGRDSQAADVPPTEVLWEGLLQDGDLLYIPRGWWHVATPLDEPTLHLTVGVNNPTGADFLSWFTDKLRDAVVVREDLPHLHGSDSMLQHAERLRAAISEAWQPGLLTEYMEHLDSVSRTRPSFGLPWSATDEVIPGYDNVHVHWTSSRLAAMDESEGVIVVPALGRKWRFAAAAGPILDRLIHTVDCTSQELEGISGLDRSVVRSFLRELAASGLVTVL